MGDTATRRDHVLLDRPSTWALGRICQVSCSKPLQGGALPVRYDSGMERCDGVENFTMRGCVARQLRSTEYVISNINPSGLALSNDYTLVCYPGICYLLVAWIGTPGLAHHSCRSS